MSHSAPAFDQSHYDHLQAAARDHLWMHFTRHSTYATSDVPLIVRGEGAYVYEAPGETHTLVVEEHVPEMITMFQVNGAMIYVDPDGKVQGYEDVFTKIEMCKAHYAKVGLGADYVERFIR